MHLLRTGDEVMKIAEEHLAKHDITKGRFGVLMALWGTRRQCNGPHSLTPAELADRSCVTRATMTGLIDTLVRDGLVTRAPHADDRRMMCVQITPRAESLLATILPEHFKRMAWLLQPLGEDERRTLVALLTKVHAQAAQRSTPTACPATDSAPQAAG